ncbi:MAG: DUF1127 domain-containing protein [Ancalomicrobiaceae bacterium]|nr:DUF1127 domain-containing protein [Ancalomicrobiaceae bacterium]
MRELALEIARQRDDFNPSFAHRAIGAVASLGAALSIRRDAAKTLDRLKLLDDQLLNDIGLSRADLDHLPASVDPVERLERLAERWEGKRSRN